MPPVLRKTCKKIRNEKKCVCEEVLIIAIIYYPLDIEWNIYIWIYIILFFLLLASHFAQNTITHSRINCTITKRLDHRNGCFSRTRFRTIWHNRDYVVIAMISITKINLTIAPVPAKQPWWIWINTSCEFIMNDCITTTKQSTTKPCAYFLGYTVHSKFR